MESHSGTGSPLTRDDELRLRRLELRVTGGAGEPWRDLVAADVLESNPRAGLRRKMGIAPLHDRDEHRKEIISAGGQHVLVAIRLPLVQATFEHAGLHEVAKSRRQH